MIRKFKLGDVLKNPANGQYTPDKNIWSSQEELKINGIQRYDAANEVDINRPIKDLVNNDAILEKIIKSLTQKNYPPGIAYGASLKNENLGWQTEINLKTLQTRRLDNASIPFIYPFSSITNIAAELNNTDSDANVSVVFDNDSTSNLSNESFFIEDGLIIGQNGNFFSVETDYNLLESVISKVLYLEPWFEDYISIEEGSSARYKINLYRKENGISGDTSSKTITDFEFDFINGTNGLISKLKSVGFVTLPTTSTDYYNSYNSILFSKFNNRIVLRRASTSSAYLWNFIVFNETTQRLECWYHNISGVTTNFSEYSRYSALESVKEALTTAGYTFTIFYSVPIDGSGNKAIAIKSNGHQGCGLSGKEKTSLVGFNETSPQTYRFRLNINNGGLQDYSVTLSPTPNTVTYNNLIASLNAISGIAGNAEFRMINGDLVCTSISGGSSSTIELRNSNQIHARATSSSATNYSSITTSDQFTVQLTGSSYITTPNPVTFTVTLATSGDWVISEGLSALVGKLNQDLYNAIPNSGTENLANYIEFTVNDLDNNLLVLKSKDAYQGNNNTFILSNGSGNPLNNLNISGSSYTGSSGEDLFSTYPNKGISGFTGFTSSVVGTAGTGVWYKEEIQTNQSVSGIKFFNQILATINTQAIGDEAKDPSTPEKFYKWNGVSWVQL